MNKKLVGARIFQIVAKTEEIKEAVAKKARQLLAVRPVFSMPFFQNGVNKCEMVI